MCTLFGCRLPALRPLQAFVLPAIAALPPYKTWIHLKNNVLSHEIGKRMFYTGGRGQHPASLAEPLQDGCRSCIFLLAVAGLPPPPGAQA